MHPDQKDEAGHLSGFPRARGDAAVVEGPVFTALAVSPQARGCTLARVAHHLAEQVMKDATAGLPTRVGMHPVWTANARSRGRTGGNSS
jgi:hypothetical protein